MKDKYYIDNEYLQTVEFNELRNKKDTVANLTTKYIDERETVEELVSNVIVTKPTIDNIAYNTGFIDFTATYPSFDVIIPYIKLNYTAGTGELIEEEFYNVQIINDDLAVTFSGVLNNTIGNNVNIYEVTTQELFVSIEDDTYEMTETTESVPEYSSGTVSVMPLKYWTRDGQGITFSIRTTIDSRVESLKLLTKDGTISKPTTNFSHSGFIYEDINNILTSYNIANNYDIKSILGLGGYTAPFVESNGGSFGTAIYDGITSAVENNEFELSDFQGLANHPMGFGDMMVSFGRMIAELKSNLANSASPVGSIIEFYGTIAPDYHLILNGDEWLKADYPFLYDKVGGQPNVSETETTFTMIDFRDYYTRALPESGRSIGEIQGDAIRNITGNIDVASPNGQGVFSNSTGVFSKSGLTNISFSGTESSTGASTEIYFDASTIVPTADENRPKSISVLKCIRYTTGIT